MEPHERKHHAIQDRENVQGVAAKRMKRGLAGRGALGDMDTNVPAHSNNAVGTVAVAGKKARNIKRTAPPPRSNRYAHITSKVDSGLNQKRRCVESTASIATTAAAPTKTALKGVKNPKPNEKAGVSHLNVKKNEDKKYKNNAKSKTVRKECNETEPPELKPMLRDPNESVLNLKLSEASGDDVVDINAGDVNNPLFLTIYVDNIYSHLMSLERQYKIEPDYLKNQAVVTGRMRASILEQIYRIHSNLNLMSETYQRAVGLIDRYLQVVTIVERNQLELVGVTALFIASKYEEMLDSIPAIAVLVNVTNNKYRESEIFNCEIEILQKLKFSLSRPIPINFLRRYILVGRGSSTHHHLAKYFVDLSLAEYTLVHYRPSELASAAICLSLCLVSNKNIEEAWTPTLAHFSKYTLEDIIPIVRKIARVVVNFEPDSEKRAVYEKYLDPTLEEVSSFSQLKGEVIYELSKTPKRDN